MELLLKKLKIPYDQNTKLPDDPAILLLGIYQKKKINSKRYIYPKVHSNIIYNCHNMEANEQIKKLLYIYIYSYVGLIPGSGRSPGGGHGNHSSILA